MAHAQDSFSTQTMKEWAREKGYFPSEDQMYLKVASMLGSTPAAMRGDATKRNLLISSFRAVCPCPNSFPSISTLSKSYLDLDQVTEQLAKCNR